MGLGGGTARIPALWLGQVWSPLRQSEFPTRTTRPTLFRPTPLGIAISKGIPMLTTRIRGVIFRLVTLAPVNFACQPARWWDWLPFGFCSCARCRHRRSAITGAFPRATGPWRRTGAANRATGRRATTTPISPMVARPALPSPAPVVSIFISAAPAPDSPEPST